MNSIEFRNTLEDLCLTQSQLARIFSCTTRAVSMWANDERKVPGTVIAYLRLFSSAGAVARERELRRTYKLHHTSNSASGKE